MVKQHSIMEKDRLKLIVQNLELLVDSLKAEVYSDPEAYKTPPRFDRAVMQKYDYDEVFNDDDGYPD